MEIVKMFTRIEIEDAINNEIRMNLNEDDKCNVFELFDAIKYYGGNDVAIHYYVQDPENPDDGCFYNEQEIELNKYLIKQGCKIDEEILDITW